MMAMWFKCGSRSEWDPPCHAAESQDSNEGEVLVTGMIREMASPSERGPRTSRGPPKHCRWWAQLLRPQERLPRAQPQPQSKCSTPRMPQRYAGARPWCDSPPPTESTLTENWSQKIGWPGLSPRFRASEKKLDMLPFATRYHDFAYVQPHLSIDLRRLASHDRFLAKSCPGLKHLQKRSRNTFCKTEPLRALQYHHYLHLCQSWSLKQMSSCVLWWRHGDGGGSLSSQQASLTHRMTRVDPQGAPSASWSPVPGQLLHCITSWEASAGWLTMGVSTSNHGDIKIWTLLRINSFVPVLKCNTVCWNQLRSLWYVAKKRDLMISWIVHGWIFQTFNLL